MNKNRIEAFTDGVLAIIITIMILEMEVPEKSTPQELLKLASDILVYILSYAYVGIYWVNHHHLFNTVKKINGKVLWTNLILLFFLSLIPFATKWLNINFDSASLMFYGLCLIGAAIAYFMLIKNLMKCDNGMTLEIYEKSKFKKEIISILIYIIGIIFVFISIYVSIFAYALVALIWIIPDKKIETYINGMKKH